MGIAFGILALGGTEPDIHLGVIYPLNCNVRFKKYYCNTRVKLCDPTWHVSSHSSEACCELLYPVTLLYFITVHKK